MRVSYKKQALVMLMLLGVFLVVVELAVNVWLYNFYRCSFEEKEVFKDVDPEINRKVCIQSLGNNVFNEAIFKTPGTTKEINEDLVYFNSEGFRSPEFSQEKPENTYRIFILGGSALYGWGVQDNQTISYYLQELYDKSQLDFKVEIINTGQLGWWSGKEYTLLKERLLSFEPNLFIVYDGWNDARYYFLNNNPHASPEHWKDRWIKICELGKQSGYQTIILLQPLSSTGNKILTEREYKNSLTHFARVTEESISQYAKHLPEIKEKCTLAEDLRGVFDGIQGPIYYDFGHTGSRGNEIIGEKIYRISSPVVMTEQNHNLNKLGGEDEFLHVIDETLATNNANYFIEDMIDEVESVLSYYNTPKIFSLIFRS